MLNLKITAKRVTFSSETKKFFSGKWCNTTYHSKYELNTYCRRIRSVRFSTMGATRSAHSHAFPSLVALQELPPTPTELYNFENRLSAVYIEPFNMFWFRFFFSLGNFKDKYNAFRLRIEHFDHASFIIFFIIILLYRFTNFMWIFMHLINYLRHLDVLRLEIEGNLMVFNA